MRTLFLAASVLTLACGGAERTPLAPASPEVAPPAAPSALLPSPVAAAPTGVTKKGRILFMGHYRDPKVG